MMRSRVESRVSACVAVAMCMLLLLPCALQAEIVALYNFEDGTATDIVSGHDGTLWGGAAIVAGNTPGVGGSYALDLDGIDGSMILAKEGWWNNDTYSEGFSVSFWLRVDATDPGWFVPFASHSDTNFGNSTADDIGLYQPGVYGWWGGDGLGAATLYGWQVDNFAPGSLVRDGGWHQYAFTYNRAAELVTAYVDGDIFEGPASANAGISFSENGGIVVIGNDSRPWMWGPTNGLFDDVAFWNHELTPAAMNEVFTNGVEFTALVPDSFEDYSDDADLQALWSNTNGSVALDTVEVYDGSQSMKVDMAGAGVVSKVVADQISDFTFQDGENLRVWTKGQAGQTGDLILNVVDANDIAQSTVTLTGGMGLDYWNPIDILVDASDPNLWPDTKTLQIAGTAAGTFYVDEIGFINVSVPDVVVHWEFDESSGKTASDSSGNNIHGILDPSFKDGDWVIGGGHTGEPGDNALRFSGTDPNHRAVDAYNVLLPDGIDDIFEGNSSWTMNQWIYLNNQSADEFFGGFGYGTGEGPGVERSILSAAWAGLNEIFFWGMYADINTITQFDIGRWQMITVVYDGDTRICSIYKNANLIGQSLLAFVDTLEHIFIATDPTAGSGIMAAYTVFDGLIDDFCIWDDALAYEDDDDDMTNDVLSLWGSYVCSSPPAEDSNNDCRVDLLDLAEFAVQWLECTRYPASFCN